jgi:hypothetical protein
MGIAVKLELTALLPGTSYIPYTRVSFTQFIISKFFTTKEDERPFAVQRSRVSLTPTTIE